MKLILLSIFFALVLGLSSCNKTCFCTTATLYPNYVGFTSAETDSVILRRYTKASQFTRLIDTVVVTANNAQFSFSQDTLSIRSGDAALRIRSFYDYILYLPEANRSDSVYGIYETRDTEKGSRDLECNCINRILSFYQNNNLIQVTDPSSPQIFINK